MARTGQCYLVIHFYNRRRLEMTAFWESRMFRTLHPAPEKEKVTLRVEVNGAKVER